MTEERRAKLVKRVEDRFQEILRAEYLNIHVLSTSGGFSTVLKGLNIELQREEALKAIDCDSSEFASLTKEKVEQEVTMLAKLDNKYVVKVYHKIRKQTEDYDYMFIVMELCDSTLADTLKGGKGIGMGIEGQRARRYLEQIVKGVSYLHSKNIIHRDLKLANIFLKEDQVKIGDFNISKEIGIGVATQANDMLLTVPYAPPERLILRLPGDKRTDIWSIGVVYYYLLQGHLPFTGDNHQQLMDNIEHIKYPPLKDSTPYDLQIINMTLAHETHRATTKELFNFVREQRLANLTGGSRQPKTTAEESKAVVNAGEENKMENVGLEVTAKAIVRYIREGSRSKSRGRKAIKEEKKEENKGSVEEIYDSDEEEGSWEDDEEILSDGQGARSSWISYESESESEEELEREEESESSSEGSVEEEEENKSYKKLELGSPQESALQKENKKQPISQSCCCRIL